MMREPYIRRRLEIDAAHRLMQHESKCFNLHGHRYKIELVFSADHLDRAGRILDFGLIKGVLGGWLDREWDHKILLQETDPIIGYLRQAEKGIGRALGIVEVPFPPSAEHLAGYLAEEIFPELLEPYPAARLIGVRVFETPNCMAFAPGPQGEAK